MNRSLSPQTNPTGLTAAAGAIYAVVQWGWTASGHKGSVSPIVVAIAFAVASLFARFYVTPTSDPRDAIGRPLAPLPATEPAQVPGGQPPASGAVTVVLPSQPR